MRPFNLSKFSRRDPPEAFDLSPNKKDPYRNNFGLGQERGTDLLRPGNQPSAIDGRAGGGSNQFENDPNWPPSDVSILNNDEGVPNRSLPGIETGYGSPFHGDDSPLSQNSVSSRLIDDNNRDRSSPFSNMSGVLESVRRRIKTIN